MEKEDRHHFKELNALKLNLDIAGYSSEFLNWGYIEPKYWRNYRHIHSFFEVCYAAQGHGRFRIYGEAISVEEGDLFFARPNEPHDIISSHDAPLEIFFWAFTLVPRTGSATAEGLFAAFVDAGIRRTSATNPLRKTVDLLLEEITTKRLGYHLAIQGLAANLLIETARLGSHPDAARQAELLTHGMPTSAEAPPPPGGSTQPSVDAAVVLQVKRYLQDNYMHPIRLKEIAAQVHLSERHICRLYSQGMGISIQQHLAKIRVSVAKQMLLDPTISVAEIASATGFADQRYFATFFKRSTGKTPTEYRQHGGTAFLDTASQP